MVTWRQIQGIFWPCPKVLSGLLEGAETSGPGRTCGELKPQGQPSINEGKIPASSPPPRDDPNAFCTLGEVSAELNSGHPQQLPTHEHNLYWLPSPRAGGAGCLTFPCPPLCWDHLLETPLVPKPLSQDLLGGKPTRSSSRVGFSLSACLGLLAWLPVSQLHAPAHPAPEALSGIHSKCAYLTFL